MFGIYKDNNSIFSIRGLPVSAAFSSYVLSLLPYDVALFDLLSVSGPHISRPVLDPLGHKSQVPKLVCKHLVWPLTSQRGPSGHPAYCLHTSVFVADLHVWHWKLSRINCVLVSRQGGLGP